MADTGAWVNLAEMVERYNLDLVEDQCFYNFAISDFAVSNCWWFWWYRIFGTPQVMQIGDWLEFYLELTCFL